MSTKTQTLHLSAGREKLLLVQFVNSAAFAYNATNYYLIEARVLRAGQTYPETIGSSISLATRSLVANEAITLYESDTGLRLNDGDSILARIESAGSPAILANPSFVVEVQAMT